MLISAAQLAEFVAMDGLPTKTFHVTCDAPNAVAAEIAEATVDTAPALISIGGSTSDVKFGTHLSDHIELERIIQSDAKVIIAVIEQGNVPVLNKFFYDIFNSTSDRKFVLISRSTRFGERFVIPVPFLNRMMNFEFEA